MVCRMTDRKELGNALSFALGALLGAGVVAWFWHASRRNLKVALPKRRTKTSDDEAPLFI